MGQTFTQLYYHLVFSTKERYPFLDGDLQPRMFAYLGGILRELRGTALQVGGMLDHVHILCSLPPTISISKALQVIKANSSGWLHETWPERRAFAWQAGYGAFSVSRSSCDSVQRYIVNQQEHHRRLTFKEEFIRLLKKHGIEYDERYLWE
jgi:REP element-mobilizing transposase RayT